MENTTITGLLLAWDAADTLADKQNKTIERLEKEIVQLKAFIDRNDMKIKEVRKQLFDIQL
jgi:hypothetical protein|tara:strand:- start:220 stop:402 length:183 start_codon:yes stop_codon:yes gene_type:complete